MAVVAWETALMAAGVGGVVTGQGAAAAWVAWVVWVVWAVWVVWEAWAAYWSTG